MVKKSGQTPDTKLSANQAPKWSHTPYTFSGDPWVPWFNELIEPPIATPLHGGLTAVQRLDQREGQLSRRRLSAFCYQDQRSFSGERTVADTSYLDRGQDKVTKIQSHTPASEDQTELAGSRPEKVNFIGRELIKGMHMFPNEDGVAAVAYVTSSNMATRTARNSGADLGILKGGIVIL